MKTITDWMAILDVLDYAFQPIVNPQNGQIFGYEALLRNWKEAGFPSIQSIFDTAAEENSLLQLDEWLRLKVMGTFLTAGFPSDTKLFYNIDNRLFQYPQYSPESFARKLEESGFPKDSFYIEISENHKLSSGIQIRQCIAHHREYHIRIALDDFGVGYSGLQVLLETDPDLIKLDRYFISGIAQDPKKRRFVQHVVEMAHVLGIQVIAEGVETISEFYACREIGCDLVQGYGIQPPYLLSAETFDPTKDVSEVVYQLIQEDKRNRIATSDQILEQLIPVPAFSHMDSIEKVLQYFKDHPEAAFVPVLNANKEPYGIVQERDFKGYLYSPFGYELLKNKNLSLKTFIRPVPILDLHTRLEKYLEAYALAEEAETLLVTNNGRYVGCLSHRSLLQLIHEKEIRDARDQNPLTRLKGNQLVNEYLQETLVDSLYEGLYVYFDFDHFKPYNDVYGFRQGDRVILLFADLLREYEQLEGWFIGHIGGDDFFAGIPLHKPLESMLEQIKQLRAKFMQDVIAFYAPEDRERGYLRARDRKGKMRRFPLLGVSAAIVAIRLHSVKNRNLNTLSRTLAQLKKKAKETPEGISFAWLTEERTFDSRQETEEGPSFRSTLSMNPVKRVLITSCIPYMF